MIVFLATPRLRERVRLTLHRDGRDVGEDEGHGHWEARQGAAPSQELIISLVFGAVGEVDTDEE